MTTVEAIKSAGLTAPAGNVSQSNGKKDVVLEINIRNVAKDALNGLVEATKFAKTLLISAVVVLTNTVLTATLYAAKLTGCTVITALGIGVVNMYLMNLNTELAKHAWTPLKDWASKIESENTHMLTTAASVFSVSNWTIKINCSKWAELFKESGKAAIAPTSAGLNVVVAGAFVGAKVLYFPLVLPGAGIDILTFPLYHVNRFIADYTFTPFQKSSAFLLDTQKDWIDKILPH